MIWWNNYHYLPSLLPLLLLLSQLLPAQGNYVIFESVGQMATSLSYLHVKIDLNLTSIQNQYTRYIEAMIQFNKTIVPIVNPSNDHLFEGKGHIKWFYESQTRRMNSIIGIHLNEAKEIEDRLKSLRSILPHPTKNDMRIYARHLPDSSKPTNSTHPRQKRIIGWILGAYGTHLGLYNREQIRNLQNDFQDTREGYNKLIEVVKTQDHNMHKLETEIFQLRHILDLHINQSPGLLSSQLFRIETQLHRRLDLATHVIQMAQVRRLSVDLLSFGQLTRLFTKLHNSAAAHGCTLLLDNHSDLFQIEVSYFSDGLNVNLLLHVPMVSQDSIMRLFKFHSFPLPTESTEFFATPHVDSDILAITVGSQRYSAQLSSTDLLGCHSVNNVYLCENNGVLLKAFNDTCLGSLYQQNLPSVKTLCELHLHPAQEVVRQLHGNWFAIFSPVQTTVPIECRNGTSRELMVPYGVSKFHLSNGCKAHFLKHLVISDYSIKAPADFLEYNWDWDPILLTQDIIPADELSSQLSQLRLQGIRNPSLKDLKELKVHQQYTPGWWAHLVHFTGNAVLIILIILLGFLLARRLYQSRQAIQQFLPSVPQPAGPIQEAPITMVRMQHLYDPVPNPTRLDPLK